MIGVMSSFVYGWISELCGTFSQIRKVKAEENQFSCNIFVAEMLNGHLLNSNSHMRKLLACFVALLLTAGVMAQNRSVTGRVTDAQGSPLPKITVSVKGSNEKAVTDENGSFKIVVPESARQLSISGVGFLSRDVAIGSGVVNVSLSQDVKNIDEVVVVGYQTRKKREEGGAVSQVKGKEIANLPNVSVDRALQGRAAGVLVQANNGIPGGAINVRIRGASSILGSTQPLFIVDGVQFNTGTTGSFTQNNPLAFLNPNDIESIDILKDAASAAIYGSQAANGVVLITTKKGKGGKTKFGVNAMTGATNPLKKFDVLNTQEYVNMRAEADFNRYATHYRLAGIPYPFLESQRWALGELSNATGLTYGAVTSAYSQAQVDSLTRVLPTYDWQDLSLQTGVTQNVDVSASGGNDRTTFYIGGNYTKQSTIFQKVDFERYGLNLDVTNKVNDRLSFNTKLNFSTFNQKVPFATSGSFLGSPMFASPLIVPVNPVKNPDGSYFGLLPNSALAGILNQNIIAVNDFNSGNQRTNQLVGSFSADYKINKWLSYRAFVALDYNLTQGRQFRDPRSNDGFAVQGRGTVESNWRTNLLTTHTLNFKSELGKKGRIDGLVGYENRRDVSEGINAEGIGFPSFQFTYLASAATPQFVGDFYTINKRTSVFGRVNYSYDNRFAVSVLARRDGSSRFGLNNQFGTFWGVMGSWNLDNEKFMQKYNWVSQLRLRASYGQNGFDQIGNFSSLTLYGSGAQYNGAAGINFGGLGNPNLSWETKEDVNLGIDFGFFNNRIYGSAEYFNSNRKDALLNRDIGFVNGAASYTDNVGTINVKGAELTLNVEVIRPKKADGFKWTTNFNFAFLYNKITQLYGGLQVLPDPSIRVGRSVGSIFTQVYAGVNPATGRPMFVDTFNNLTYLPQLRDRRYIGDQEPDYIGGFGHTFSYKGFALDALFTYEYGRMATDGQVNFMLENGNRTFNTLRFAYEGRWTKPGDVTSYPRIFDTGTEPGGVNHVTGSSRIWRKADFIRLRDIRLSYTFPTSIVSRLKLSSATFYVQGQNLWTYTEWWGYDPEFVGTTTGIIPQTKNVNVGLQIGF